MLSLDTTAVLLTPVVLALAARLGLPVAPFAYGAVWIANAGSRSLPVSNLWGSADDASGEAETMGTADASSAGKGVMGTPGPTTPLARRAP